MLYVALEGNANAVRDGKPYVFTDLKRGQGVAEIVAFLERHGGLTRAEMAL